jgi:hypothetical protein
VLVSDLEQRIGKLFLTAGDKGENGGEMHCQSQIRVFLRGPLRL